MSEQQFDIYFSGRILPDQDPDTVKQRLGQLFRLTGTGLERLFSGTPVRIKQGVDAETAKRYQETLRKAGAIVELRYPEPADAAGVPAAEEETAEAPAPEARTAAPETTAGDTAALGGISLAPPGVTMDETTPPPPLEVDTSELTAGAANSGSLEDCVWEKPAVPIPDISRLKLEDD